MPKYVTRMAKSGESESYAVKDVGAREAIEAETEARAQAVSAEAEARAQAVSAEAEARAQAVSAEAEARASAEDDLKNTLNQTGKDYGLSESVSIPASTVYNFMFPGYMAKGQKLHLECESSSPQFSLYKVLSKDGTQREAVKSYVTAATWNYEADGTEKVYGFAIWVAQAIEGSTFSYSYEIINQWSAGDKEIKRALSESNILEDLDKAVQTGTNYDYMFDAPLFKGQRVDIDTVMNGGGIYNVYKITGPDPNQESARVIIANRVSKFKASLISEDYNTIYGFRFYTIDTAAQTKMNISIVANGVFPELSKLSEGLEENENIANNAYSYEDTDISISETHELVVNGIYQWMFDYPVRKGQLLNIKLSTTNSHMIVYKIIDKEGTTVPIVSYVRTFEKTLTSTDLETIYGIKVYIANTFIENDSMDAEIFAPSIMTQQKTGKTIIPKTEIEPVLANLKYDKDVNNQDYEYKPYVAVHFSDVHGDADAVQRIIDFSEEYTGYIDEVIHTGDAVLASWENGYSDVWYNQDRKPLQVIGNHDAWTDGTSGCKSWSTGYSAKQCYTRYIQPIRDEVTTVQDKCYWYKKNESSKVMLIAIDNFHWNETIRDQEGNILPNYPNGDPLDTGAQLTWFVSRLEEAAEEGYGVVVLSHFPAMASTKNCSFTSLLNGPIGGLPLDAITAVQNFIDGGGEFITWLCGHTHWDYIGELTNHQQQSIVVIDSARAADRPSGENWQETHRIVGTRSENLFNIFSVDRNKKYITLFRVGMEYDKFGRHIGSLVYDYDNKEVIWNS